MGQDSSKSITPPPLSLLDCLSNGQVVPSRYIYYQQQVQNTNDESVFRYAKKRQGLSDILDVAPKVKRV